jgi:glycosyltransferase involved in cell wall biosynthesis
VRATILTLGLYRGSGGPSKSIKAFADALDARVISWVDSLQYARDRLIWAQSTVVRGSRLPVLRQLLVPARRDELAEAERIVAESDVVSCHSFWRWHVPWLHRVAKRHRVPYWFVPHGILDPYAFESERLFKRAFLSACARGFLEDAAAVVCSATREYEKLREIVPHAPPAIIHWPLTDDDFRERSPAARSECRRGLGIPEEAFCLLAFGRLDPMKQPLETIDAVAEGGGGATHLIVMGNEFGVSRAACERRAADHGLADRVHVVGPKYGDERLPYLDACDAYISLSHRENFNFTAMECLASGIPVILSAGNDIAGDIGGIGCGWMMPVGGRAADVIEAARAAPRASLPVMGAAGREWARRHLSVSRFQKQLGDLARRCAEARR